MSNHTYSISEIVGTSPDSVDAAVRSGINEASKTLRNLDWFEVKESPRALEGWRGRGLAGDHKAWVPARALS